MRVRLQNIELREARVSYNRGRPKHPGSNEDLEVKFRTNAGCALPVEKVEELRSALVTLNGLGAGARRTNDTGHAAGFETSRLGTLVQELVFAYCTPVGEFVSLAGGKIPASIHTRFSSSVCSGSGSGSPPAANPEDSVSKM